MNVSHYTPKSADMNVYTPKSAFDNQKPPSQVDVSYAQSSTAANGYTKSSDMNVYSKSSETNVYAETFNQELQNSYTFMSTFLEYSFVSELFV